MQKYKECNIHSKTNQANPLPIQMSIRVPSWRDFLCKKDQLIFTWLLGCFTYLNFPETAFI